MTSIADATTPSERAVAAMPTTAGREAQRPSVADVTERLMGELGTHIDLAVISATVLDCHEELTRSPSQQPPRLLERLARHRLLAGPQRDMS